MMREPRNFKRVILKVWVELRDMYVTRRRFDWNSATNAECDSLLHSCLVDTYHTHENDTLNTLRVLYKTCLRFAPAYTQGWIEPQAWLSPFWTVRAKCSPVDTDWALTLQDPREKHEYHRLWHTSQRMGIQFGNTEIYNCYQWISFAVNVSLLSAGGELDVLYST
jgi:hypothetical protein